MDLDVTLGNGRVPLVVHYWVDLQLVHEFGCYGNICALCEMSARMLVLTTSIWLVVCYFANSCLKELRKCIFRKDEIDWPEKLSK